jgi:hypothetical protein
MLFVGSLIICGAIGVALHQATVPQSAVAKATSRHTTITGQTGYCQVNGCIDLPPDGYCPSGYYRFQGTACCCPIHQKAHVTEIAKLDASGQPVIAPFLVGSMLDVKSQLTGRQRCGA